MATSAQPSTALARHEATEVSLLLEKEELKIFANQTARDFITPRLSHGVTFEQVVSEVYSCILNEPKLAECYPPSLVNAVAKACSWGLPIGEKVFIAPFKNTKKGRLEATAMLGYRGAAELVVAAGGARAITSNAFYENERFEYEEGTSSFIKHVPIIDPKKRGALVGGYAVAILGAALPPKIKVMHRDEIDAIRMKYSKGWKVKYVSGKELPLLLEEILWYVEKTPILQLVKLLPTNPRLARLSLKFDEELVEAEVEDLAEGDRVEAPDQPEQRAANGSAPAAAAKPASQKADDEDPYNF